MADMQAIFRTVDALTQEELEQLHAYVEERRQVVQWWVVPSENLRQIGELLRPVQEQAAQMPEEEVNQLIDDAIAEVRRERKNRQSRN